MTSSSFGDRNYYRLAEVTPRIIAISVDFLGRNLGIKIPAPQNHAECLNS